MAAGVAFPLQTHAPRVDVLRPPRHVDRITAPGTGHHDLRSDGRRILRRTQTRLHRTAPQAIASRARRRAVAPPKLAKARVRPRRLSAHRLNYGSMMWKLCTSS